MAGRPPLGSDADWVTIDPSLRDRSEVPPIPSWIDIDPGTAAEQWYYQISMLPQARLWNDGTISQLWLSLPLVNKYFERPGSEGLKAIASLNTALLLTEDDMRKARVKFKTEPDSASTPEAIEQAAANVTSINKRNDRKARLTGS